MKILNFVLFILLLVSNSGLCGEGDDPVRSTVKEEDKNSDSKIDYRIICTHVGKELRAQEWQSDTDYNGDFDLVFGKIFLKGQVVCSWTQDKRNKKTARSIFIEGKEVLSEGNYNSSNIVDTIVMLDSNRMPHTVVKVMVDGKLDLADSATVKEFQDGYR